MSGEMDLELLLSMCHWDTDELLLFALATKEPNNLKPFNLDELTEEQCIENFRFKKADLIVLGSLLMPAELVSKNRIKATGQLALCILLRRLAYPNRLSDLVEFFGKTKTQLSVIFKMAIDHIYSNYKHLLSDLNQPWFKNHLPDFASAINEKGAPLSNCVGFIDGTVRPICRPSRHQKACFNGHKRVHALKFQSVLTPDGMILNMHGPVEGRRHDSFLLYESNILVKMSEIGEGNYCLYGDPAYPLRPQLITGYAGVNLTEAHDDFNKRMSACRQAVEWGFSKILSNFAFLDFKKNLKLFLQPVGKYYLVATLLTNCHTCVYGSQTSTYFRCHPPSLEYYLRGQRENV